MELMFHSEAVVTAAVDPGAVDEEEGRWIHCASKDECGSEYLTRGISTRSGNVQCLDPLLPSGMADGHRKCSFLAAPVLGVANITHYASHRRRLCLPGFCLERVTAAR